MSINSVPDVPEMVTVPRVRYEQLLHASKVLNALYAGGVDNWEWYGESLATIEDEDDEG